MTVGDPQFGLSTLIGAEARRLACTQPLEEPLVVHGDLRRWASFVDLPPLRAASAVIDAWDGAARTLRAWSPVDGPAYEIFPDREQLMPLYDAGCTLVFENVERFVPALRPLCRTLERDLGIGAGKVNVEVFCARGRGRGRPHFDPSFTFNCQIAGRKTWRLARSDAVRFPCAGMFLGRSPPPELAHVLHEPVPSVLTESELVVAEPGTVVFLPPGVLHETQTENGSYAIAFAIEEPDSIARCIAQAVRIQLETVPLLRAPRLGPQFGDVAEVARDGADVLRRLADEIETWAWPKPEEQYSLPAGLSVERNDTVTVTLRSPHCERTAALGETAAAILEWASRETFSLASILAAQPHLDPDASADCIQKLLSNGLMEIRRDDQERRGP